MGELRELGVGIARATIYKICKEHGQRSPPVYSKRFPMDKWTQFIKCNMDSIVACDFFSKNVFTSTGTFAAYSLAFIHYGTRRVYVSPPTYNPDTQWLMQQARNVSMWLEEEGIKMRYLVRDQDGKFPRCLDEFFENIIKEHDVPGHSKGKVIKTAIRCPNQNAYIESWIGHAKSECFNFFVCFSLQQFNRIIARYMDFHNNHRPHQGRGNVVINPDFSYPSDKELDARKVRCKSILAAF